MSLLESGMPLLLQSGPKLVLTRYPFVVVFKEMIGNLGTIFSACKIGGNSFASKQVLVLPALCGTQYPILSGETKAASLDFSSGLLSSMEVCIQWTHKNRGFFYIGVLRIFLRRFSSCMSFRDCAYKAWFQPPFDVKS